jgi:hypothetical protein
MRSALKTLLVIKIPGPHLDRAFALRRCSPRHVRAALTDSNSPVSLGRKDSPPAAGRREAARNAPGSVYNCTYRKLVCPSGTVGIV